MYVLYLSILNGHLHKAALDVINSGLEDQISESQNSGLRIFLNVLRNPANWYLWEIYGRSGFWEKGEACMESILTQVASMGSQSYQGTDIPVVSRKPRKSIPQRYEQSLKEVLGADLSYVPHSFFSEPQAESQLFATSLEKLLADQVDPAVLLGLGEVDEVAAIAPVLLSRKTEEQLFLRYNFSRMKTATLVLQFNTAPSRKLAAEIDLWHRRAVETRELITRINMALVIAMAKRTKTSSDVERAELISEGNVALFRAVEKFDVSLGFKFSTYACRAILKGFSRAAIRNSRYRTMFAAELTAGVEQTDREQRLQQSKEEAIMEMRRVLTENRASLTQIEKRVIESRFVLDGSPDDPTSNMTLEEIGNVIGVTKERVRQIQVRALEKLRFAMERQGVV